MEDWMRLERKSTERLSGLPFLLGVLVLLGLSAWLFIAGARDDVLKFPGVRSGIEGLPRLLPRLRGCHILEGAGHWIQQERPDDVNRLLLDFLGQVVG